MNEELLPNLLTWMLEYIKELQQQVKDLEQKLEKPTVVDKKEYNKRFTNRKYLKPNQDFGKTYTGPLVGLEPQSYPKPNPKKLKGIKK